MMSKPPEPTSGSRMPDAELADLVLELRHRARREDPRHEAAVHAVQRRVLEQDHARRQLDARLDDVEDVAARVRERLPVDERLLDVRVSRQRPEVVPLVVVDRRFLAETRVRRVRVGVDVDVVRVEVHAAALLQVAFTIDIRFPLCTALAHHEVRAIAPT